MYLHLINCLLHFKPIMTTSRSLPLIFLLLTFSLATDTIKPGQLLRDDGRTTIVSPNQTFELGFFSPPTSTNRYVGIWYKGISVKTPVWVANRASPLTKNGTSPGFLTLTPSGSLVILDRTANITLWSSSNTTKTGHVIAQLLDSGNLVVRKNDKYSNEKYIWQSFDHPTDTLVPGMWLSWQTHLSSWRAYEDPTPGDSNLGFFEISGYPHVAINRGSVVLYRLGPWNGIQFTSKQDPIFKPGLRGNEPVLYYEPETRDESVIYRFSYTPLSVGQHWTWARNQSEGWTFAYTFPEDLCDTFRLCGANSVCNPTRNPVCWCLGRFAPKVKDGWAKSDWSGGCVRRETLSCATDVFYGYSDMKLPYSDFTLFNGSSTLEECKAECSRNCTCTAYAFVGSGVAGCMMWSGDLLDLKRVQGAKQKIFIRMALSELESDRRKRRKFIAVLTSCAGVVLVSVGVALIVWKRNKDRKRRREAGFDDDFELPMYDLSTVVKATNNFSDDNKLGEGGFGPAYKGVLENGMEVAVKRLSESSSQGPDEFKNEVICIAKLQHRNLVKLLGCCIQGHEKILLYEYMPHKSLDLVLYNKTKGMQLDWAKRFHIINGVARGILYLHQDSQLRIIHRDLKASNVLLDNDLNPKISDFGMARIFGGNETEAQTRRVVGTYGYMSPEYAGEGLFSIKSDVYSFGVLVLEIVSGQRNRGFQHESHNHNLIGHAWLMYKEGRSLELVDPNILSSITLNELLRSIHVALLCVQQCPEDRPTMASVVLMLGSGGALPEARQPGFFTERQGGTTDQRTTSTNAERPSNEYTITLLAPR